VPARAVDEVDRDRIIGGAEMPIGPPHQAHDHRIQVERALRQPVLIPVGVGPVADPLEHAVADEPAQALGQDIARDAEVPLELPVAADAEEGLAQDQERPAIAEDVNRELDGVARRPYRCVVPSWQLVHVSPWIDQETSFDMKP
jgi:hypothetical protein